MITSSRVRPQAWTHFKSFVSDSDAQLELRAVFYTVIQGIVCVSELHFCLSCQYLLVPSAYSVPLANQQIFSLEISFICFISKVPYLPISFYLFFNSDPEMLTINLPSFLCSILLAPFDQSHLDEADISYSFAPNALGSLLPAGSNEKSLHKI